MQIFVNAQTTHVVDVDDTMTVADLKNAVGSAEDLPIDDLLLTHAGRPLEDDELLCGVLSNSAGVDVTLRIPGGKVHGSLARAGKVRGQTPKVDKQEKKKKKTGRAKRRMQYNRRFVNVVAGFGGRRRGPNSNQ
ncbi:ubiquitin-like FUBI-ribosomal protein eS30 fusion protein [Oscarella lobularis]|uniref:ubiquitin-like FUBI-ribosomal protein eS30 fusion protein n=1 Tax=Oscarella lobularis TaxID=121494 RepID=UPI0033143ECB